MINTCKWIYLSYILSEDTPEYGGEKSLIISNKKQIVNGDSCNTSYWSFSNHTGTHIDFPAHFYIKGNTVNDYSPDFWFFKSPFFIDISTVKPKSIIGIESIDLDCVPSITDILIIKTGFCKFRNQDTYWKNSPGFSPELGHAIKEKLHNIRVFGFDLISISSLNNKDIGRKAHQVFLNNDCPILLIEDMNLSSINNNLKLKQLIVSPIRVERTDASPCTIFAEVLE